MASLVPGHWCKAPLARLVLLVLLVLLERRASPAPCPAFLAPQVVQALMEAPALPVLLVSLVPQAYPALSLVLRATLAHQAQQVRPATLLGLPVPLVQMVQMARTRIFQGH